MKRLAAVLTLVAMMGQVCLAGTRPLKQSTAIVTVVGPFVDTAGAAVTAPTIASIDITAYKNDGTTVTITPAASGTANDMVHTDDGYFSLELTTTDTATAGYLRLTFQISGSLIFHEDFEILPTNVYDSRYGSANLLVDVAKISGDTTAADNAESFFDGTGYAGTNNVIPLVTTTSTATALGAGAVNNTSTTLTETLTADVISISGDTTAADNAEAFFDGTGYAGTNNVIPLVTLTTTATNLTNLPTAPANWLTASAASAGYWAEMLTVDTTLGLGDIVAGSVVENMADRVSEAVWVDAGTRTITALPTMPTDWLTAAGLSAGASQELINLYFTYDATGTYATATAGSFIKEVADNGTGGSGLDAAGVRAAIGMAAANLDTQLSGLPVGVWAAGTRTLTSLAWQASWDAEVESETQDALVAYGALKPTTAGRTLDVLATGEAGIDWGNIANQNASVNLSSTVLGTVDTVSNLEEGAITAPTFADGAITDLAFADNSITGIATSASYESELVTGIWTNATRTLTALPAPPTDWLTAASVSAGAVTKIQATLATAANQTAAKTILDNMFTAFELDTSVYRLTVNALEMAPAGGGGGGGAVPLILVKSPTFVFVPRTGTKVSRTTIIVRDTTGALADPTGNTVTMSYADPDGGALPAGLPATATRESVGRYKVDVTVPTSQSISQKITMTAVATVGSTTIADVGNTQFTITPPAQIIVNP